MANSLSEQFRNLGGSLGNGNSVGKNHCEFVTDSPDPHTSGLTWPLHSPQGLSGEYLVMFQMVPLIIYLMFPMSVPIVMVILTCPLIYKNWVYRT